MEIRTLEKKQVTQEEVFAVFQDQHRHAMSIDYGEGEVEPLGLWMSVAEWRDECDLLPWRQLARAYNDHWNVEIPLSEWKQALTPARSRTLSDVCQLLAKHVRMRHASTPVIFGRACRPVGMFFAVRELLEQRGVEIEELRPSTCLHVYTREHCNLFTDVIAELAPGKLPTVRYEHPAFDRANNIVIISMLGMMITLGLSQWFPFLWIPFAVAFPFALLWSNCVARYSLPQSVTFGELRTFCDLCNCLVKD